MNRRVRLAVVAVVLAAAGAFPAVASAHAVLERTTPVASATVPASPTRVTLTFDEAVEPRFAVISVTDAGGHQQVVGTPYAVPGDPDTLAINVRHLPQGWYLVYWRAISADGHPVRGAFTFAVGPDSGRRATVRDSVAERIGGDPRAGARSLARVSLDHDRRRVCSSSAR